MQSLVKYFIFTLALILANQVPILDVLDID